MPKENTNAKDAEGRAECKVAQQLRRMHGSLPEEEKDELATIREKEVGALEELEQEPDPEGQQAELDTLSVATQHAAIAVKRTEVDQVMADEERTGDGDEELTCSKRSKLMTERAAESRKRKFEDKAAEPPCRGSGPVGSAGPVRRLVLGRLPFSANRGRNPTHGQSWPSGAEAPVPRRYRQRWLDLLAETAEHR